MALSRTDQEEKMTRLIELREWVRRLYGRHSRLLMAAAKFALALFTFLNINHYVGYASVLDHIYVALLFAVICAFLPMGMTLFIGAVMIVIHLYALSMEGAVIALLFFLIMFFLYFRFTPKSGGCVVVTPLAFALRIPYVMPIATGLLGEGYSIISVIFGTMLYYFLNGVHNNAALLDDMSGQEETVSKFVVALNQLLGNKEMYLVLAAFVLATLVVYIIRRQFIDHAWTIAIGAGLLIQFVILCAGYLIMGLQGRILWLVFGMALSGVISMLIEFFFFNLDYSRTERVQFEDDEYYYYVKAVPKINLSSGEKQVKKISGKKGGKREGERITKKQLAKELDIDEDMLD